MYWIGTFSLVKFDPMIDLLKDYFMKGHLKQIYQDLI